MGSFLIRHGVLALVFVSVLGTKPSVAQNRFDTVQTCADGLRQPSEETSGSVDPAPLRILSWNIMKFSRDGARELLGALSVAMDFVLLQESVESLNPGEVTGFKTYFARGYRNGNDQTGVEIRSRRRADVFCTFTYMEPWLRSPKAVAVARFPSINGDLLIINLHGINFTLSAYDYRQQLASLGALLITHGGPVIVAGDFNHWNPWRQTVLDEFAANYQLDEVPFDPDLRSLHFGTPLDSVFTRGLDSLTAMALQTEASDHHPLVLILQASPQPAGDTPAASDEPEAVP